MKKDAAKRLEDALELADIAERMVRLRLMRSHPGLSVERLEEKVLDWLQRRRGPVDGDAEGRAVTLGRRS